VIGSKKDRSGEKKTERILTTNEKKKRWVYISTTHGGEKKKNAQMGGGFSGKGLNARVVPLRKIKKGKWLSRTVSRA